MWKTRGDPKETFLSPQMFPGLQPLPSAVRGQAGSGSFHAGLACGRQQAHSVLAELQHRTDRHGEGSGAWAALGRAGEEAMLGQREERREEAFRTEQRCRASLAGGQWDCSGGEKQEPAPQGLRSPGRV